MNPQDADWRNELRDLAAALFGDNAGEEPRTPTDPTTEHDPDARETARALFR